MIRLPYHLILLIGLSLLLGFRHSAFAQRQQLHFTAITSKDGLPSNTVNAFLKDRYGLLWFATEDGLAKFNGLNFKIYRHDTKDSNSIQGNEVSSLYEDNAGRLWVGTSGGLHLYDRRKDHFLHYKESLIGDGFSSSNIKGICSDKRGNIWVATLGGINMLNPTTNQVTKFGNDKKVPWEVGRGEVLSVYTDRSGLIWIGTKNGLFTYDAGKKRFVAYKHREANDKTICGDLVKVITEDKAGLLWFGTSSGLSSYDSKTRAFTNITSGSGADRLSSNTIYALSADDAQNLWIGTENGLNILNIKSGKIVQYFPVGRDLASISGRSVRSVLNDRDGISWIGTYDAGVSKYDRNLTFFSLKRSNPYDVFGLNAPFVSALAHAGNDDVYVGTDGGGLSIYHPETGLFERVALHNAGVEPSALKILALERSRNHSLWIGTYQSGLFQFDPVSGNTVHFTKGNTDRTLNNNEIFCLKEDKASRVWVGTNGGGVNVYDPQTKSFIKYGPPANGQGMQYMPLNGYIRALEEDRQGRMWIGSYGTGIAVYDPQKRNFEVLNQFSGALPSNKINTFMEDRKGNMWVGTGGDGLMKINPNLKKIELINDKNGLADVVIHALLEDPNGRIWMSTNKGISWLNPSNGKITNYSYYNGLQYNSFKNGACLMTKDGTMFFGGGDGLNFINSQSIKFNHRVPEIIFTELKLGNKTVTGQDSLMLDADISIAKTANLAYKQNFSISFVALNFTSPRENRYRYRLIGFDKDWISAGNKTTAYYTNLSPGQYTFEVIASNNDGIWSKKSASLKICIEPPFWKTIWAYMLYAVLVVSSLLIVRYRGIQKLKHEFNAQQSKREAERLHELDKLKIKFLTNLSHDLRTPISLIMGPVDKMMNQGHLDSDSIVQLKVVKRNTRRLINLVNQLLDFRQMQERELKLNLVNGDIIAFTREVCESFQDLSEKKQIAFVINTSINQLYIPFDPDKLERILFNLLSNAFKFISEGGKVMLVAYLKQSLQEDLDNTLVIEISDTGIGIEKSSQALIFERFYQSKSSNAVPDQGSGIGLSIVKEFVQMHGGQITVDSTEGVGTTFRIELSFKAAASASLTEVEPTVAERGNEVIEHETQITHERQAKNYQAKKTCL